MLRQFIWKAVSFPMYSIYCWIAAVLCHLRRVYVQRESILDRGEPLGLHPMSVVLTNLSEPGHALAVTRRSKASTGLFDLLMLPLKNQTLELSMFTLGNGFTHGVSLISHDQKVFINRFATVGITKPENIDRIRSIHLRIVPGESSKTMRKFRLIASGKCLSLAKNYLVNNAFTLVLLPCEIGKTDQIWGMFTAEKAMAFATEKHDYIDNHLENLNVMIDKLHESGRNALERF